MATQPDATGLLNEVEAGDHHAADKLLEMVYDELHELAAAGALDNARDQMWITGPPHKMRPQGHGMQIITVGLQYKSLSLSFRRRIVSEIAGRVGLRFVDAAQRLIAEDHARRARKHETPHALSPAGRDHMARAIDIDGPHRRAATPQLGHGGDVKHDVHTCAGH